METSSSYLKIEEVNKTQRRLLITIVIAFWGFLVWSAMSPLDLVSMADGSIEPVNKVQTVQHLEGGIVKKIHVKEGQNVVRGQVLLELETTNSLSAYREMLSRVNSLTADQARLIAELNGASYITFDEAFLIENASLAKQAEVLFSARRNQLMSALQAQDDEMKVRESAVNEIVSRIRFSKERLLLVHEQSDIEKELLSSSLSSRYDQLNSLKEVNQLESEIEEDAARLAKAQAAVNQAKSQMVAIQDEYNKEVNTILSETRNSLSEGLQRLKIYKDSLERTVLRAPMDGIIKNLYVVTEGGVIAPGGTVVDMVPGKDGLIVEAKLPPQDIGHIKKGQSVFVQLASGEAQSYGRLMGEVDSISPDTITTEEGEVFYVVRMTISDDHFGEGDDRYKLSSGVLVTAGIITGKRSVLAYILSPVFQSLPFALTER